MTAKAEIAPLPYGSWRSPITSALIVAETTGLSETLLDGGDICWLETRPRESGRNVVVRRPVSGGDARDVNAAPFNARTRVHEYGGGAWTVDGGTLYFSNDGAGADPDRRLHRWDRGADQPLPLTSAGRWRYADGVIDRARQRWIGVREDHSAVGHPENAIVAVDLDGSGRVRVLASGHDFFSSPRLSPDGGRLAWLAWDHPNMPWVGTTLEMVRLGEDGAPAGAPEVIAGGAAESIFQPEWSPDGSALVFVSDRTGWWNLYRYELVSASCRPLAPMAAEFGQAQWVFGLSTYAFAGPERIVASYVANGLGHLALIDAATGAVTDLAADLALPFTTFGSLRSDGASRIVLRAGAPDKAPCILLVDLAERRHEVVQVSSKIPEDPAIARCLSKVEPIEFPTEGGKTAFGLFYPPCNPDCAAPPGEKPPLLVKSHGGPTSAAASVLNLSIQYWTSRGIAVLDVNYGGSTGYGRAYRDRLHLAWGEVDVDDCVNGARYLAQQGRIDGERAVISGGSAGGYTTLAALTFRDFFKGGASHYGVSDAAALAGDTHKFESRYLDWLIGPYPQKEERYRARSPAHHAERLSRPVIFFQGDEDRIVPPDQTERMVDALRARHIPVGYLLFTGEQHGFRQAGNIQRALDAELYFYAFEVFGVRLSF
jgi:dipeptidyl aminopeptidase/acylaminoacyl peptidase